ncbi:MAG: TatD family hydrolase, partial [Nitrosopumilus sp.]|nr:TatD family hydrolase [Nitrosopumilus sp.]
MTWLFDSHIHLSDPAYQEDLTQIIKGMEQMKIKACCVSMDYENSRKTLEIAKQSELILPFIGIHPECANGDLDSVINLIQDNISIISGI